MRSTLFLIPLQGRVSLGPLGEVPLFGFGLLLAVWLGLGLLLAAWRVARWGWRGLDLPNIVTWGIISALIVFAPRFHPAHPFVPIYGYGAMLFVGFLCATMLASRRLEQGGVPKGKDVAWDVAMWIFVGGIVGARLFFVIQYRERFFLPGEFPFVTLQRLINLPDGGLVFYGGMILGAVAYFAFCRTRRLHPLALGDILITSVFVGYAFGRLGCFLNGCCFGDYCELPWAVTFPAESVPWKSQVFDGFLAADAARSLPVHPTQIYSSLGALVLAAFTWAYHPYRRHDGEVLALGMLCYPINRFLVEFLRGDELGQWGTMFTISQWVSAALFAAGLVLYVAVVARAKKPQPLVIATA